MDIREGSFLDVISDFYGLLFIKTKNHHSCDEMSMFFPELEFDNDAIALYFHAEFFLNNLCNLISTLHNNKPQALHPFLGNIKTILDMAEKELPKPTDKQALQHYKKIQQHKKSLKAFLATYKYKDNPDYRANSSILFNTLLHLRSKPFDTENMKPGEKIIRITRGDDQNEELSLADIADKFLTATGVTDRNSQFISIAISNDGQVYITSNKHTPTVFRLDDILHGRAHFQAIDRARREFNRGRDSKVTMQNEIHAETMMAALKEPLNLNAVLVVDAKGIKVQNCLFCSQYLTDSGFSVETHSDKVINYILPSAQRVNATVEWLEHVDNDKSYTLKTRIAVITDCNNCHNHKPKSSTLSTIKGLMSAKEQVAAEEIDDLETAVNFSKKHYPYNGLQQAEHYKGRSVKTSYHCAKALASPEKAELTRTSNNKGKATTVTLPNDRVYLYDDGHLPASRSNANRFSPRPDSPRSLLFTPILNAYVDAADGTVSRENGFIEINRNPRGMAAAK